MLYFGFESGFSQWFELDKDGFDLGFSCKRKQPAIAGEMVNKDNIVFVVLVRCDWRLPDISEEILKRCSRVYGTLLKG